MVLSGPPSAIDIASMRAHRKVNIFNGDQANPSCRLHAACLQQHGLRSICSETHLLAVLACLIALQEELQHKATAHDQDLPPYPPCSSLGTKITLV